jgi:ABC-type nitrate/sulfonate/bicarbonate transport system substrate-binding protein
MLLGKWVPLHLAAVLLLAAGMAVTAPRAAAQAPRPITIGYLAGADWLLYTARDLKLFEREGLAPTFVTFPTGVPMIAAAESKSIDVGILGIVPFLLGLAQGVDWVMIGLGEGAYSQGIVAGRDSGIETTADLKGKKIGYFRGSGAHYGVATILGQSGIRLDQVTLVHMAPADQLAALAGKEIDAAMVWEPWIQRMRHEAGARVIATEGKLGIYVNVSGFAVRRDWLRDNRETAVRFLRALLAAHDVLQKDDRVAINAGARAMGISDALAETIYQETPPAKMRSWTDPRYRYSLVKGAPLDRRLVYLAAFLLEQGIIPQPVSLRGALDASVIADALKAPRKDR